MIKKIPIKSQIIFIKSILQKVYRFKTTNIKIKSENKKINEIYTFSNWYFQRDRDRSDSIDVKIRDFHQKFNWGIQIKHFRLPPLDLFRRSGKKLRWFKYSTNKSINHRFMQNHEQKPQNISRSNQNINKKL